MDNKVLEPVSIFSCLNMYNEFLGVFSYGYFAYAMRVFKRLIFTSLKITDVTDKCSITFHITKKICNSKFYTSNCNTLHTINGHKTGV